MNRELIGRGASCISNSLKILKTGLDPTTDENTYTSCWIGPDFTALRTGIDDLISKGYINENHFWPSALRRRLARGVENAKGTMVDGYWYAMDDKVDIILENIGSPSCKDYKRRDAHIVKCERNAVDALLHRFQRRWPHGDCQGVSSDLCCRLW